MTDALVESLVLTPDQFNLIAKIAKSNFGLNIESSKHALIQSRLRRRLRACSLPDFGQYLSLVESGEPTEVDHFIGALTTNVTKFYREPHHFTQLERDILPNLIRRVKDGDSVRIWSAGCSTGQEPYSIAATCQSGGTDLTKADFRILATDLDPFVLQKAESAIYDSDEIEFGTEVPLSRIFVDDASTGRSRVVRPDLRRLISFARLNLQDEWPMRRKFDVIFCRNVVIYFDQPTQEILWKRFADILSAGGHLFIGHSERLHGQAIKNFESAGLNCYRRK